jgi:hypothetical protein
MCGLREETMPPILTKSQRATFDFARGAGAAGEVDEPPRLVEKKASKTWEQVFSSIPQPVSIKSSATPSAVR